MPDDLSTGQLRVGDADRETVADLLAAHHAAGRLTLTELEDRLDTALSARTRDDLGAALAELPVQAPERPAETRPDIDSGRRAHLTAYVAVIAGLWLIWMLTGFGYPWPIWPMLGWGLGLLGHRSGAIGCGQLRAPARG